MAGALVGGSVLSAFLQVLFDRLASQEVLDFFKGRSPNDGLFNRLKIKMISVNGVLDDAEEKQLSKPAVKEWLDMLKDVAYEAEDLLDEISYEALQPKLEARSPQQKVRKFFSSCNPFKRGMKAKLEAILERLEYLVKQMETLGLREGIQGKPSLLKTPTTSLVDESGIYGRENDKEAIMELLLSDDPSGNDLGVIPIVGMGGIGKTTLAQLIYNDERVQEMFHLKAWICFSEEFDVLRVTKDILEELTQRTCDIRTLNRLQLALKERVMGKKIFLVFDDVWNDKYADWDILQRPFKYGAKGSKIVVTTRNTSVASIVQTVPIYHLKQLNDDDCWSLFSKHAFEDGGFVIHPNLKEIGWQIVGKCKGLPLIAKTLGGLLHFKRDVEEWENILKSTIWELTNDSILPALKLSYHYLPPHLKRCFGYCALFPKDYNFHKKELVLLWMAEGFIVQPQGSKEIEDVGNEYFQDLVSRSFFQRSNVHPSLFIMHDLLSDLAKVVSGEFCFRLEGDDTSRIPRKTRHLSYERMKHDTLMKFDAISQIKNLRTFLPVERSGQWGPKLGNEVIHNMLPMLKSVRVLSLSHSHCVNQLLDYIGNLKLLRYLNLSRTSVEILPDTVSNLFNLQMLTLRGCKDLVVLPDSIGNLKHLRYLDLYGTPIQRLPESLSILNNLQTLILCRCKMLVDLPTNMGKLTNLKQLDIGKTRLQEMPPHMCKLTKLKKLTDFVLGNKSGSSIKELGELQDLRGGLYIRNLQHVGSQEALEANLKVMKHLTTLKLRWAGSSWHDRNLLRQLQPHRNLKRLSVVGYGGSSFPNWVGQPSLSNVVSLKLSGCKYSSSLPPLGQLASLKDLSVAAFDRLDTVGDEFYGSCASTKPFGSLKILRFESMPQWHEWISYASEDVGGPFPLLQELSIRGCPKLVKALPRHLPSLVTLEIEQCKQLVDLFPNAPTMHRMKVRDSSRDLQLKKFPSGLYDLKIGQFSSLDFLLVRLEQIGCLSSNVGEIRITDCDSLSYFPLDLFPALNRLYISRCSNLESIFACEPAHGNLASVNYLDIEDCPKLIFFHGGELSIPNLTCLRLRGCSNLKLLSEHMNSCLPSLLNLEIYNCPELESFPNVGSTSSSKLRSLQIERCNKLIAARGEWNLQLVPSLQYFSFGGNKDVESFPEEMSLPLNLISLKIWDLENLRCLDYRVLQGLTSLRELKIGKCPKLESMLEDALPSTLQHLDIRDLENLKSFGCRGLKHHTSLRDLEIWHCPKLQSMPKDGLPSSLSSLFIYKCPLLEQSCQLEKGKDWPNISHVSRIKINGHNIN